jgi:cytochrome c1
MRQDRTRFGARSCLTFVLALGCAALLLACHDEPARIVLPGGDPDKGKAAIVSYGCGACHTIPGVATADGTVGPPLDFWSRRSIIAGEVPNTPANLIRWIQVPQSIEPTTAMPNLGVSEAEAKNIAAYLYTLK